MLVSKTDLTQVYLLLSLFHRQFLVFFWTEWNDSGQHKLPSTASKHAYLTYHLLCRTWLEDFQRQCPLCCSLGAVVLHDGEAQEAHLLKVHGELKVLAPHGVEGVAMDGFGAEVAAVDRHAQNVDLETGAASAVTGTDVLTGDDLREDRRGVLLINESHKQNSLLSFVFTQHRSCFQVIGWSRLERPNNSEVTLTCQEKLCLTFVQSLSDNRAHTHKYRLSHRFYECDIILVFTLLVWPDQCSCYFWEHESGLSEQIRKARDKHIPLNFMTVEDWECQNPN